MAACCFFLCPEGQRGAEGSDCLADSPADVLGDHRQHVLLWRWALWARAAMLTPPQGTLHQHYFLWQRHPYSKGYYNKKMCLDMAVIVVCGFIIYIFYVSVTIKIHPTMSGRRSQAAMRATWLRTDFVTECPILCLRCVCRPRSTEPWSATASLKRQITCLLLSHETRVYKVKVSVFFEGEPMMSLSYAVWWPYLFDVIVHIANKLFFPLIEGPQKDRLPQKGGHGHVPSEPLLENPDKKVIFPLSYIFYSQIVLYSINIISAPLVL